MAQNITKLTVVKKFTYRDANDEEWSNGYVFKGLPPTTTAEWDTLRTQVVGYELPILNDATFVVRVIGHSSTDPGAIASYEFDYTVPGPPPQGTFNGTGVNRMSGDQAACVEWLTQLKTIKGKPIYLRKYIHGGWINPIDPDQIGASYMTALTTYANHFVGTTVWGGLTNNAGTAVSESAKVLPFSTTRTLERRGKRKKVA